MMYAILWESFDGERKWEAVQENQIAGFLEKLINGGVMPATVMVERNPRGFRWMWPKYHKGLSEVNFANIDKEICGSEPVESKHVPVDVPARNVTFTPKYGWLAPDGRFFGCGYGGHSNLADKIVGEIVHVINPERHLEDFGWAKILHGGSYSKNGYAIGMGLDKKLTDAQLKTLQSMGLEDSFGISFLL